MNYKLNKLSRQQLNQYMQDCFGEDGAAWDNKRELISDIVSFGKGKHCLEYFDCLELLGG